MYSLFYIFAFENRSQYLPMADQSHLYIAYHQGFAKVIDRIRAKYKDVVIQC